MNHIKIDEIRALINTCNEIKLLRDHPALLGITYCVGLNQYYLEIIECVNYEANDIANELRMSLFVFANEGRCSIPEGKGYVNHISFLDEIKNIPEKLKLYILYNLDNIITRDDYE